MTKNNSSSDFINIRNCCFLKDTAKREKRQVMDFKKRFVNHICDKGFEFRIY